MTECNTNGCTLNIGNFKLDNNKWGAQSATQSIFVNSQSGPVGFSWNNSFSGFNFPEIIAGTNRNCTSSTWSVLPIQYSKLNSCSTNITWKFTQKPTSGSWWNLAFDIYWMDNTSKCDTGKMYNMMIWIHGTPSLLSGNDTYIKDVNDGNNTWSYYNGNRGWSWDCFILKNRIQIPYEPVLNQEYSININIKALMSAISRNINTSWYVPGIEFGCESSGSKGVTAGRIEISKYNLELNGNSIIIGSQSTCPDISISMTM